MPNFIAIFVTLATSLVAIPCVTWHWGHGLIEFAAQLKFPLASVPPSPLSDLSVGERKREKELPDIAQNYSTVAMPTFASERQLQGEMTSAGTFCMDGRIAPTFFLIGAQKAGTSSFAAILWRSAQGAIVKPRVLHGEPSYYAKEVSWFDGGGRFQLGKPQFLKRFPSCSARTSYTVTWDCTPILHHPAAPFELASYYENNTGRLQFVILLREPVGRLQSRFAHLGKSEFEGDFAAFVSLLMKTGGNSSESSLDGSLYAPTIQRWFTVFDSSQFLVVPMQLFTSPPVGKKSPIDRTLERLHIAGGRSPEMRLNVHEHGSLSDELGAAAFKRLTQFIHQRGGSPTSVAQVLARSNAELHGFSGDRRSAPEIAAWLEANW